MLDYIKSKDMVSVDDIDDKYPGCMYLLVDINNDFNNLKRKLYCVSHSADSFEELCNEDKKMVHDGRTTALLGIYSNYSACAAQYMLEM